MSVTILTVLVALTGIAAYTLLNRLVAPVRVIAACVLMVLLTACILIVENRLAAALPSNSSPAASLPVASGHVTLIAQSSTHESEPAVDLSFQRTRQEDRNFLDEMVEKQKGDLKTMPRCVQNDGKSRIIGPAREPLLRTELAANSAGTEHLETPAHKETVKRAQLVTHAEMVKHVAATRTRQQ
jgi:hypothetical protein